MILMYAIKHGLFFAMVISLFNVTAADAEPVYGYRYLPAAEQYPESFGGYSTYYRQPGYFATSRRPTSYTGEPPGYHPVTNSRYQGYRFRPWQQNNRYRPAYPQRRVNHKAYQWRPMLPQRPEYRWYPASMPQYQVGNYPVPWGYPRSMPRFNSGEVGHGYTFPPREAYTAQHPRYRLQDKSQKTVYRPVDIKIPNYYVFRPLEPKHRIRAIEHPRYAMQQRPAQSKPMAQDNYTGYRDFKPAAIPRGTEPETGIPTYSHWNGGWTAAGFDSRFWGWRRIGPADTAILPSASFEAPVINNRSGKRISAARFTYPGEPGRPPAMMAYRSSIHPGYLVPAVSQEPPQSDNRYQRNWSGHTAKEIVNSYDGLPDTVGSWYKPDKRSDWFQLSQTDQVEYSMVEYDGADF